MGRFGVRAVVSVALLLTAAGSGLSVGVTSGWQLVLLWGVLIGLGTGSMALVFAVQLRLRDSPAELGVAPCGARPIPL